MTEGAFWNAEHKVEAEEKHVHQQERQKFHYHYYQLNWITDEAVLGGQGYPTADELFQVLNWIEESLR